MLKETSIEIKQNAQPSVVGEQGQVFAHARRVIFVRHGLTSYNAQGRLQGQIDIPLNDEGRAQAERTGAYLRELYAQNKLASKLLIVSSELGRAFETAHIFADPLGLNIHVDSRVKERYFGSWEGMSGAELAEQYPEDYAAWRHYRGGELKHGAETKRAVGLRGSQAILEWNAGADNDTDIIVFSHGAWISCALQTLLGLDDSEQALYHFVGMNNAHWATTVPIEIPGVGLQWRVQGYNQGPETLIQ